MAERLDQIDAAVARVDAVLAGLSTPGTARAGVERFRSDAAALRFHLRPRDARSPLIIAVIGGTGTGKSTLVNRLLKADITATNFRRTYTSGSVAVVRDAGDLPRNWLGVPHVIAAGDALPARGDPGSLIVAPCGANVDDATKTLLAKVALVDTPDLDGDQPAHHAEADRAFRWAQALIFLVSPEKYQMTELLPYYRLAARYAIPLLFVMNKCEEQAVADDYREQLGQAGFATGDAGFSTGDPAALAAPSNASYRGQAGAADATQRAPTGFESAPGASVAASDPRGPTVFTIARDDAGYEPPADQNLAALREAIQRLPRQISPSAAGAQNRAADLLGRFEDQVLGPLQEERREADRLTAALAGMETPVPGVDVNPVTQELERRLQQRSVLYLMGPQRVIDRVRQAPGALLRLPRVAFDLMVGRKPAAASDVGPDSARTADPPDFQAVLTDQFSILQSRIDDLLRTSSVAQRWMSAPASRYATAKIDPRMAGKIADDELADLRAWLEKRWNATPLDTRVVQKLLGFLPGAKKAPRLAEAAPYLLALGLLAHHALFGTDLLVIGGYTVATWITERLSNEVANRTRSTNSRIADRFTKLAHEQIHKMRQWIESQAAPKKTIDALIRAADDLATAAGGRL